MPERPAGWLDAYDQDARRAVAIAQDAAVALGHNYIGSEHLLIGLTEVDGPARDAIAVELSSAGARLAVEQIVGRGEPPATNAPGLTPRARLTVERAHDIASAIGSASVAPIHVLVALAELDVDAVASMVFRVAGVDQVGLRRRLWQVLEERPGA